MTGKLDLVHISLILLLSNQSLLQIQPSSMHVVINNLEATNHFASPSTTETHYHHNVHIYPKQSSPHQPQYKPLGLDTFQGSRQGVLRHENRTDNNNT